MPPVDPDPLFDEAGGALNVDPMLLRAVARVETGGAKDPDRAVSPAGALGRMQVMPPNLQRYNVSDPTDPKQNIYAGAAVLDEALTAANGNVPLALRIYQGGQDQSKWGPNNAAYPGKVAAAYQAIAQRGQPVPGAPAAPAAPDATDAFLTGGAGAGAAKAPAAPDATDDFLSGKAAAAATPAPAATATQYPQGVSPNEYGITDDPQQFNRPGASSPAADRIGAAVAGGWNSENPLMTPKFRQMVESAGPVGMYVTSPLLQAGGAVLRGANALGSGASAAIGEGGNALLPGLGRDLNMLAQVAPLAHVGTGTPLTPLGAAPEAAATPKFVSEHYAPPPVAGGSALDRINQLIAHDDAETTGKGPQTQTNLLASPVAAPPIVAASQQSAGAAVPGNSQAWVNGVRSDIQNLMQVNQAAGIPGDLSAAATPEQLAQLTPAQMKAYRRMAELKDLLTPIVGEDKNTYVEGSTPTLAEWKGDPLTSQAETMARQNSPNDFTGPNGALTVNSAARVNRFEDMAGTDPQLEMIKAAQEESRSQDEARILRTAQPADLQPALDHLAGVLDNPRLQERDAVLKVMGPMRDKLMNADGTLKTDPQSVWGMHDNLIDKLETAKNDTSAERFVVKQLTDYKNVIDGVMNKATNNNFQTFLDNQSGFFQQRNALEQLQKFRPGMTDKNGNIYADKFHRWAVDLAVKRGRMGVDPAMDIPDDTMAGIINIDKDLRRAGNIDLGKARGSPTNLYFEVAKALGLGVAHASVAALGGAGFTNLALQHGLKIGESKLAGRRLNKLVQKHLTPPPGGFNALRPPD
jgi:hypothetical protein